MEPYLIFYSKEQATGSSTTAASFNAYQKMAGKNVPKGNGNKNENTTEILIFMSKH